LAWIRVGGFFGFGRRDLNADRIGEFYGKEDFTLIFTDKAHLISLKVLRELKNCNYIQFLQKHDDACTYFKVAKPYLTKDSYREYQSKCKDAYRMKKFGTTDYTAVKEMHAEAKQWNNHAN